MSLSALKDISRKSMKMIFVNVKSMIIKMKKVRRKKDDDTSSLGFETTAGGACAVPG